MEYSHSVIFFLCVSSIIGDTIMISQFHRVQTHRDNDLRCAGLCAHDDLCCGYSVSLESISCELIYHVDVDAVCVTLLPSSCYKKKGISVTIEPSTIDPTTTEPTTEPTTIEPTTKEPTTAEPTVIEATTTTEPTPIEPTTAEPTTAEPTTIEPTTIEPTTIEPTTKEPTTAEPTTIKPTTIEPTTIEPTTKEPTTAEPTIEPTTIEPTTIEPTTKQPTTAEPTTIAPTTKAATTPFPYNVEGAFQKDSKDEIFIIFRSLDMVPRYDDDPLKIMSNDIKGQESRIVYLPELPGDFTSLYYCKEGGDYMFVIVGKCDITDDLFDSHVHLKHPLLFHPHTLIPSNPQQPRISST